MPIRSVRLDTMPRKARQRRTLFTSFLQRTQISLAKTIPLGCSLLARLITAKLNPGGARDQAWQSMVVGSDEGRRAWAAPDQKACQSHLREHTWFDGDAVYGFIAGARRQDLARADSMAEWCRAPLWKIRLRKRCRRLDRCPFPADDAC